MNSPDERWWSVRAGEYVLGTLQGNDLTLFKRMLAHDTSLQSHVSSWEQQLAGLNHTATPKKPGEHVWPQILKKVRNLDETLIDKARITSADIDVSSKSISGTQGRHPTVITPTISPLVLEVWQTVAGFAIAASLILGTLLYHQSIDKTIIDGVAVVLSDESGEPYFLIETDYKNSRVRVTALAPPSLDEERNFQLWQALPDRSSVRPVARLPEQAGESRIFAVDSLIVGSDLFGVSLEPVGASTENGPTGPVVAHGDFLKTRPID